MPSMQVFRDPVSLPSDYPATVVSAGNYDGVHLGHRFLLNRIAGRARARGARAVAVTFEPHPSVVLRPEAAPPLITPSLDERLDLLASAGVDATVVLSFTPEFSRESAGYFAEQILARRLRAVEVHEGLNFRFGFRAQGTLEDLRALGGRFGFEVHGYDALRVRGLPVSSSLIRRLVSAGEVRRARWLLGRPFGLRGTPARGRGIGHRLTVPTINLAPYAGLVPALGVYITRVQVEQECFDAVTNVGTRPTFADASFAIESHLLDFRPVDLRPTTSLAVTFLARLRDERTWPSPEALREQILRDVQAARRFLHRCPRPLPSGG